MNDPLQLPRDNNGIEMSPEEHSALLAQSVGTSPNNIIDATSNTSDISDDEDVIHCEDPTGVVPTPDTKSDSPCESDYEDLPDMDVEEAEEDEDEDIDEEEEDTIYELGHIQKIKYPFRYRRGKTVYEVNELVFKHALNAGKVEDLSVMGKDGHMTWGDTMKVIALCTGYHYKVIRKLATTDLVEAGAIAMSFFGNGHQQ